MAEFNQFGSVRPGQVVDPKHAQFESMLADAVDGSLSAEEQKEFDLHLLGCSACGEMLADAKRGAAWMELLRQQAPEPPAAMLERILAQTSGIQTSGARGTGLAGEGVAGLAGGAAGLLHAPVGVLPTSNVLPFRKRMASAFDLRSVRHTLLQPRLAMTAAMAFFSIALTLNLTGVRLSELKVSDLKPSSVRRSIYESKAHVVRYYTNLRVVYELESRVHDLQSSSDRETTPAAVSGPTDGAAGPKSSDPANGNGNGNGDGNKEQQPEAAPPKRKASPGTSRREPMERDVRVLAAGLAGPGVGPGHAGAGARDEFARLAWRLDLPGQGRGTV